MWDRPEEGWITTQSSMQHDDVGIKHPPPRHVSARVVQRLYGCSTSDAGMLKSTMKLQEEDKVRLHSPESGVLVDEAIGDGFPVDGGTVQFVQYARRVVQRLDDTSSWQSTKKENNINLRI